MLNHYHSICAFLCEADPATLNSITFEEICLRFHADPVKVNRIFYSVLGMCGEDVIEQYKEGPMNL